MQSLFIAIGSVAALTLALFTWLTSDKRAIKKLKNEIAEKERQLLGVNVEIANAKKRRVSDTVINDLDRYRMRLLSEIRSLRQELKHYE